MIKKILLTLGLLCTASFAFATTRPLAWDSIKHVVIIIFENTSADSALQQPYMKQLAGKGAYFSQFYAITHPSEPNYIALVAGSTLGVTDDSTVTLDAVHLGDLLDAKGLTWKAYAEDLPTTPCYLGSSNGDYARKHEPFISFRTVQTNPIQCSKIVPAANFFTDAAANNLPTFSLYVPNQRNDGHNTGIAYADNWLSTTFGNMLSDPAVLKDTLFVITFDEDNFTSVNRIYTAFVGAGVKAGTVSSVKYSHYSLLRTIEDIFDLGSLCQNDQTATPILDVWTA